MRGRVKHPCIVTGVVAARAGDDVGADLAGREVELADVRRPPIEKDPRVLARHVHAADIGARPDQVVRGRVARIATELLAVHVDCSGVEIVYSVSEPARLREPPLTGGGALLQNLK